MVRDPKVQFCSVVMAVAAIGAFALGTPLEAKPKGAQKPASIFDAAKRKKAKHNLSDRLSYSAYGNVRFLSERDIARDDGQRDMREEVALSLGLVGRAQLSHSVAAFVHLEASLKDKKTHAASYGRIMDPRVKEALVAFSLSPTTTLSVGRLRFADAHKWVADASVDGAHLSIASPNRVLEFAAFRGTEDITSTYAMAHVGWSSVTDRWGGIALAERDGDQNRVHLSGYFSQRVSATFSYQVNVATIFGDAANGENAGLGLDVRATKKLGDSPLNPQVTLAFAYGSNGFQQSGVHSNKTYDGGQTQFHRYGTVFQPELTNLAVASVGLGIRPSRKLSADVIASFYAQPQASTVGPSARFVGSTTGDARFLGSEISIVGAYRPSKKTKFELGVGRFEPGPAFVDQSPATRVFSRFSVYF